MKTAQSRFPDLVDDHYCCVCGSENEWGLRLNWKTEGKTTSAEFTSQKKHQGWKGILHGGIQAVLLDEAMGRLAWQTCGPAVTAEMTVRYVSTAKIGEHLTVTGRIKEVKGRIISAEAELARADGSAVARATGKILKI